MSEQPRRAIGRPRRSSAETLADAAAELFLENGWSRTTVDQIAQRAGVSRGTFFNHFESKSDLFWLDLDEGLDGLAGLLREGGGRGGSPVRVVEAALVAVGRAHDPGRVPWALTQSEAMGLGDELVASAAVRVVRLQSVVAMHLAAASGGRRGGLAAEVAASALVAAAATAITWWARSGVGRRPLGDVLAEALAPVADGLDAAV
jgi:AcrR family transcriptional regulator